jgi:hypothetical protein
MRHDSSKPWYRPQNDNRVEITAQAEHGRDAMPVLPSRLTVPRAPHQEPAWLARLARWFPEPS